MARFSSSERGHRRPVWLALSDLFLDTTLDDWDLDRIARVLASSPYSVEQLDDILLREVYPACRSNLTSLTGEWAGFDPEWLEPRIMRGPSLAGKAWAASVGRLSMQKSIEWRGIRSRVEARRAANTSHA